jgi:uncharacterized membrane protein
MPLHKPESEKKKAICHVTGNEHDLDDLIIGDDVRASVIEEIRKDHPDFDEDSLISTRELFKYRQRQMENLVKKEVGAMTELETQVLEKLHSNKFISDNVEPEIESESTFGEKLSDKIAEFGGSWKFIIFFLSFMGFWMAVNVVVYHEKGYDPYPFILLNLVLSCLAALQAPIIMMSQNRQNDKDRQRSEHDYQVNLAAELQIRLLHDKIDHMMLHQHKQIVEIQEIQIELMQELEEKIDKLN